MLKGLTLWQRKNYVGFIYILPWLAGFLIFQLYPFATSFYYSLTSYNMVADPQFTGLRNFTDIFTKDKDFTKSLFLTVRYAVFTVPLKLLFSLIIALILNSKVRFINLYRTIYYLPSIFGGSVAIAIVWRFLFQYEGFVNNFLAIFGFEPRFWLGDTKTALYILGMLSVWQFGSSMVIFLAALKQVPLEQYEAARVEGAGPVRTFFSITFPYLTPMLLFNLVMQTINALQDFTAAYVITNGGPVKSTYMYVMKIYTEAFLFNKMGYASALSWILFIVIAIITVLIFKFSSLWVFYEDGGDDK